MSNCRSVSRGMEHILKAKSNFWLLFGAIIPQPLQHDTLLGNGKESQPQNSSNPQTERSSVTCEYLGDAGPRALGWNHWIRICTIVRCRLTPCTPKLKLPSQSLCLDNPNTQQLLSFPLYLSAEEKHSHEKRMLEKV